MRIKLLQLFLFLSFSFVGLSQKAPDFMLTDSDIQTHHLYQDYLDKGKSVLLKIFFSSCPPCNQIAPSVQSLYEEWGGGLNDVEFLELSVMNWDNNNFINNYKNKHGITFPSVGADGGSVEATAPYRNGDFGLYTGTPTFVVIAPNGDVDFDVTGFGTQGLINALDAALTATGAQKPGTTSITDLANARNEVSVVPNPFQTETQINVSITKPGQITFELFDILGNKIETSESDLPSAGKYTLDQNFEKLRAGTYIIRVSLNGVPIKSLKVIKRG